MVILVCSRVNCCVQICPNKSYRGESDVTGLKSACVKTPWKDRRLQVEWRRFLDKIDDFFREKDGSRAGREGLTEEDHEG